MNRGLDDPRILLVHETPEILLLWRMVLAVHGGFHDVTEAHGGAEALRLMAMTQPHVIVTDYSMRDISGLEVVDAARSLCPGAVLVLSSCDSSVGPEALLRGASCFMTKLSSVTEELALEIHELLRETHADVLRPSMTVGAAEPIRNLVAADARTA